MTINDRYQRILKDLDEKHFNEEQYEAALFAFANLCRTVLEARRAHYNPKAVETFPCWPDQDKIGDNACLAWWLGSWEMWQRIFWDEHEMLLQEPVRRKARRSK